MAISDVIADNGYIPPDDDKAWAECGAGALQHDQFLSLLTAAGLVEASIEYTHDIGPELHAGIIRARKPRPA